MSSPTANIIDAGDVLIIGAGLAGLFTALKLAPRQVTVLTGGKRSKSAASNWAQGGIAAAMAPGDSIESHAQDTCTAGAGLVDPVIARLLTSEAAERISDLENFGVRFDCDADGAYIFGREAAHSHNRILSIYGDRTGREMMSALHARAAATPSIDFLEGYAAYELAVEDGRVVGVFSRPAGVNSQAGPILIRARATVIATGGSGHLYAVTTNPASANGEALAMAARAGAQISDSEFIQFHPTALTGMGDPAPLATEALRGAGAYLVDADGHRFMADIHPDGDLAPRDVVARGVFDARQRTGFAGLCLYGPSVGNLSDNLSDNLAQRFPTIHATCVKHKLDPTSMPLPVAPAAHFHMGGIRTESHGRSSLPGLWACGEAAATGAHGANRLASNSLLEAIVFGARIAEDINNIVPLSSTARPAPPQIRIDDEMDIHAPITARVRSLMSNYVGVQRSKDDLTRALVELVQLERAAQGLAPFANMVLAAQFIAFAALKREESRGGHFRNDFPAARQHAERNHFTLADLQAGLARLPQERDGKINETALSRDGQRHV